MRFDHNLIKKDYLSVTLDFRLLHICRCSSHTTVVLLNFITLVIQDVRSILVTRFAVDIDQLLSKLFWQFLVICYSSEVTCVNLFKKLSFDLSFRNTRNFFCFRLISEGNPVGLLWSKASESRGLQIDFGSIHHRIGVVINRREHDMIAFWFNLEHDVSVTTDGASTDVYFNPTFFYGLSPYSTYCENEKATFKMVKSHTRGLLKIFAKGFPSISAL